MLRTFISSLSKEQKLARRNRNLEGLIGVGDRTVESPAKILPVLMNAAPRPPSILLSKYTLKKAVCLKPKARKLINTFNASPINTDTPSAG